MGARACLEHAMNWSFSSLFLCLVMAVAFVAGLAQAGLAQQGNQVEVRAISAPLQEAAPGAILSCSFRVTNRVGQEEQFVERLQTPEGWPSLVPEAVFTLRDGAATTRVIAFQVSPNAMAGRYSASYSVRSQRDYALQDFDTIEVVVLPTAKLALVLESKPDWVLAGETYEAKARAINRGNAELSLVMQVTSQKESPASVTPAEFKLSAGENQALVVTVQTDPKTAKRGPHVIMLTAEGRQTGDGRITTDLPIGVEVIPRVTGEVDLLQRLAVNVRMRATGGEGASRLQMELRGEGSLDEAGLRRLSFQFRGPDVQSASIFGARDEYWLNYGSERFDLRLGDQTYGLSPLTEYYRYARGAEISSRAAGGRAEWGAYYLRGRWDTLVDETAAHAGVQLGDILHLRLNTLSRQVERITEADRVSDRLWSLESRLRPLPNSDLRLEYASGNSTRDDGVSDRAYRMEWRGQVGKSYYSLQKTHAAPDFYGYYHDTDYNLATVAFPLAENVHGLVSFRRWQQNLDLNLDRETAPREKTQQYTLSWELPKHRYLSLDYERFARRDELNLDEVDYEENPFTISYGGSAEKTSWRVEIQSGVQRDLAAAITRRVRQYRLFGYFRPSAKQTLMVYGSVGDSDALSGSYLLGNRDNVGATLMLRPNGRLRIDLSYTRYGFREAEHQQDQKELIASYTLPNGRGWTLRARQGTQLSDGSDTAYLLEYSIPFGVPVGRKLSIGSISGRVFDAHDPAQPGVTNVILSVGDVTAVSDKNGQFQFPALPPGTYALLVDSSSIGLNRVTTSKLPLMVEVRGGKTTAIELGVDEAARVTGTVLLYPGNGANNGTTHDSTAVLSDSGAYVIGDPRHLGNGNGHPNGAQHGNGHGQDVQAPREPVGLGNLLVEISDGDRVMRAFTDNRGRFFFQGLPPGRWRIKVYDYGLPSQHQLEIAEMELMLTPGAAEEVTFRVAPRTRRVMIIDEGTVSPGRPPK